MDWYIKESRKIYGFYHRHEHTTRTPNKIIVQSDIITVIITYRLRHIFGKRQKMQSMETDGREGRQRDRARITGWMTRKERVRRNKGKEWERTERETVKGKSENKWKNQERQRKREERKGAWERAREIEKQSWRMNQQYRAIEHSTYTHYAIHLNHFIPKTHNLNSAQRFRQITRILFFEFRWSCCSCSECAPHINWI